MAVITIRGQLGSGAPQIGRRLADIFRYEYMDRQIIKRVADRLKLPGYEIIAKEQPPVTILERLGRFIGRASRRAQDEDVSPPGDAHYLKALRSVIRHLALKDAMVISGRGSQFILKDDPAAVHVLVVAPLELRIRRVVEGYGLDETAAAAKIESYDASRRAFIRKHFKADLENPAHYDLTVNTAHVSFETAADMVVRAVSMKDKNTRLI